MPCVQLTADLACALFGDSRRPVVCEDLKPTPAMCGDNRGEALARLDRLERETAPDRGD